MRKRKLRTIARRSWPADGGSYDWHRVYNMTRRLDLVSGLIREMVRTAPDGGWAYVGTWIVEDMSMNAKFENHGTQRQVLELVLKAKLTGNELFGVLSGVYPHYLEGFGARERLVGILPPAQLAWLLDRTEGTNGGYAVAEGDGVRILPGPSEWERLYYRGD